MHTQEVVLAKALGAPSGRTGGGGGRQSPARQALALLVFMAVAGYLIGGSSLGVILVVGLASVLALVAIARATRSYWAAAPGVLRYASARPGVQLVARLPVGRIVAASIAMIATGMGVALLLEIARARQSPRPEASSEDNPLWGGDLPGGQQMLGGNSMMRGARMLGSEELLWADWLLWAAVLLAVAGIGVLIGVLVTWRKVRGLTLTADGIVVRSGLSTVSAPWEDIREIDVLGHWGVNSVRIDVGRTRPVWISGVAIGSDPVWAARLLELFRNRNAERSLLASPEEALRALELHYASKESRP